MFGVGGLVEVDLGVCARFDYQGAFGIREYTIAVGIGVSRIWGASMYTMG